MKRGRPTPGQRAWQGSEEFRQTSRRAARAWNAKRERLPRCGARRKSDGEPCQQWPMQNGRCYLHGGLTPHGDQWHRPQYSPELHKMDRKLRDRERQAKKRAARLAAMTTDERAAYERWQASHKPGAVGARVAARERRRQNVEARKTLAGLNGQGALRKARRRPKAVAAAERSGQSASEGLRAETGLTEGVFE